MSENPYFTMLHWIDPWVAALEIHPYGTSVSQKTGKLIAAEWCHPLRAADEGGMHTTESIVGGPVNPPFWNALQSTFPRIPGVSLMRSCDGYVVITFAHQFSWIEWDEFTTQFREIVLNREIPKTAWEDDIYARSYSVAP